MCEETNITKVISIVYLVITIGIPVLYLIMFRLYKARRKNYLRAFIIAIIMFLTLYSVKIIANLDIESFSCFNCYINNNCEEGNKGDDELVKSKTTTTTNTTTTISTTKVSSTTKAKSNVKGVYNKPDYPSEKAEFVEKTSNGYDLVKINGAYYIDGIIIANKTYGLPESYVPKNTYKTADGVHKVCNDCIEKTAYNAWKDMLADSKAIGLNIWIQSGYRPYSSQESIYNSYVKKDGKEKADTYSSRPGHSDHQTGLAFDLNSITDAFGNTEEGKWVNDNCYKYGFIIRFPKGKQSITGYKYESWHLRYVGSELATILYNNGDWLSLEEYYGITSKYND